jgi:hypothetical protein
MIAALPTIIQIGHDLIDKYVLDKPQAEQAKLGNSVLDNRIGIGLATMAVINMLYLYSRKQPLQAM